MKKFSWIAIFAMAMLLTMGFVSCNNEPKDEPKAPVVYSITVTDGTATPTSGQKGTVITIKANDSAEGKMFDKWTTDSDGVTFSDATKHSTTFTMPEHNVNVTATYKDIPSYVLKKGSEINKIFRDADKLNAGAATAFEKAAAAPATAEFYLDYLEKDVPVWYDEANTTIYYYIPEGKKLILNEDSSKMFAGLSYFESIDTSVFYTGNVTNMKSMFYSCKTLKNLDLRSFDTSNVQNMRGMFEACNALETLDVSSFDTSNVTDMGFMFSALTSIKQLDLSNFNTSNVIDFQCMFQSCRILENLDVSHFNTSNATNLTTMFCQCQRLKKIDVSHFNTSNVTNISFLFCHCWALESIDVSNFDTSNISDMGYLFLGCKLLKSIDLSTFDMSNVTNIKWMFQSCSELETIYVPNDLDLSSSTIITDSTEMFLSCPKLKGGAGTEYDAEKIDKTYARVDGGTTSPGYFTVKN